MADDDEKLSWGNAGPKLVNWASNKLADQFAEATPAQKLNLAIALAKVKNSTEGAAIRFSQAHPSYAAIGPGWEDNAEDHIVRPLVEAVRPPAPAVRQPIQMEREFTNQEDKEAYIERIRRAQKNAGASKNHHGRNSFTPGTGGDGYREDIESLGPSGEGNQDPPDYNYFHTGSPLDVATALETDPSTISKGSEDYMRREGLWTPKTDALLADRKIDRK